MHTRILIFVLGLCFLTCNLIPETKCEEIEEVVEEIVYEYVTGGDIPDETSADTDESTTSASTEDPGTSASTSSTAATTEAPLPDYISVLRIKSYTMEDYVNNGTQVALQKSIADTLNSYCGENSGDCESDSGKQEKSAVRQWIHIRFKRSALHSSRLMRKLLQDSTPSYDVSTIVAAENDTLVKPEDVNITNVYEVPSTASMMRNVNTDVRVEYFVELVDENGTPYFIERDVVDTAVEENIEEIAADIGAEVEVVPPPPTEPPTTPPTTTIQTTTPEDDDDDLEGWAIALIVLSSVVVVSAIGYGIYYFCFRKKKDSSHQYADDVNTYQGLLKDKDKRRSDYDALFPAHVNRDSGNYGSDSATSSFQYDNPSYDAVGDKTNSAPMAEKKKKVPTATLR